MIDFKSQLAKDQKVFFNTSEFAEMHWLNGVEIPVVIDDDLLDERRVKQAEGTYNEGKLLFVDKEHLLERPEQGERIEFDGSYYFVDSCNLSGNTFEIVISKNETY